MKCEARHATCVMEESAKSAYKKVFLCEHVGGEAKNCSLFVERCNMFLGASPDLLASCSCCGEGFVEIKCSYTCKNVFPLINPPSFLEVVNGAMKLKTSHPYYPQVQGQTGVTGRKWCDFFVFSEKGYFLRVSFDMAYWFSLYLKLVYFFQHKVFPLLLQRK